MGGREPLCFYGGAFPHENTPPHTPRGVQRRVLVVSGDFLPKLTL